MALSVNQLASLSVITLAIPLIPLGAGLLLLPQQASSYFGIQLSPETKVYAQGIGGRLLSLGVLLLKTRSDLSRSVQKGDLVLIDHAKRDLRRILLLSMAWDAIDLVCLVLGFRKGEVRERTLGFYGGGASCGLALAGLAFRFL